MSYTTVESSDAPAPAGAYSQGRRIGPFVQLSGQVPRSLDPNIEDQTIQALEQVHTLLREQGLSWDDVLMIRVHLADDKYWEGMDAAYRRVIDPPYPPRTSISAHLGPDVLVEVDALAVVP